MIISRTSYEIPAFELISQLKRKSCGNLVRNGSFIIGDIPSEEAVTYLAAIERSHMFTKDPLANINRVVLVTCELKVCVFERGKDHLLVITKYESIIFIKNRADSIAPDKDLMQYFSLLRYHDGFRLWEIVQSQGDAYLDKKVKWNEAITLNGYLDFPQSLTYPVCRGIYTHTLQRLTGLFPPHECTLVGLDGLVDSLVVRFNAEQHPRYRGKIGEFNPIRLCIGSVQVSGLTEQFGREKGKVFFHFFRHPSGTAKGLYLLPWMAKAISEHSDPNYRYERVGRTPVVAQDGWKAYRMPRFNSEGKPIYEQAPRESYRAWQEPSRTPLMIGHWNYGGHHDLLTLNLLLAFDTELDRISLALEGSMARFVYANFFRLFKLDNTQLNQRGKELFKADQNDQYLKLLPNYLSEENALLLYPSHPVTDHIMDRFLSLVADKIHQGEQSSPLDRVRSRLIAVLPIRRYRSGSGLQISGLVLKRLQDIPSPKPPVVIFDDALISGRTYSDLKRLLRSIGFKKICSLILVDRQRFASADHVESENHLCYWRLDLPSLGSEHNCPLCQARRRVGDLANHLTNPEYCKRIESWRDSWRPLNPATQWGDGGLRPIPLFLKKPERKFSIEPIPDKLGSYQQIGGDKKQIKITNSAGLAAYVSELHSITSHDDLALRILKNNESLSSEIRIQLLSSQILLFSGEFDRDLAKDLGYELMKALWDAKSHDRHTALAVLTLVGGGNAFLKQVIISFFAEESRRQRVVNCNIDIILLLVLMLFIEKSTAQPDPSLLWLNELNILWGILKTRNRTELCGWLHRVVRDCAGKQHSTPLHRFKNSLSEDFNSESINKILYSARQLQSIIDSVERHWLRTDSEGHREYEAIQKEMKQSTETIVMKLTQLSNNLDGMTKILAKEHMTEARSLVEKLLNEAEKIHDCVFTPIGISRLKSEVENSDSLLLEKLQRMQTGMDDKKIAWYKPTPYDKQRHLALINKPEMFEVYIPWDACLVTAIQDILTNIRHAIKEITNPWKTDTQQPPAESRWVEITD